MNRNVYLSISLCLGIFSFRLMNINFSFILINFIIYFYLFKCKFKNTIKITGVIFFIYGFLSISSYYNYSPQKTEIIRITENGYYKKGEINGISINIESDNLNIKKGERIRARGEFLKEKDFKYVSIGTYKIKEYEVVKDDLETKICKAREYIFQKLSRNLSVSDASLIESLVLGDTSHLDKETKEKFKKLGITHVISISGLHISIILSLLEKIIGSKISLVFGFFYVIFTGFKVSILRAFIMTFMCVMAVPLKREYSVSSGISFSCILILLIDPSNLFRVSFLLSFFAIISIYKFSDFFKRIFIFLPKILMESLSITISAQVLTIPIIMIYFESVNIGFIFANIFLIPIFSILIIIGLFTCVFINLGLVFNFLCNIIKIIVITLEGGMFLIEKITPDILHIRQMDTLLYISFLLYLIYKIKYKRDKKRLFFSFYLLYIIVLIFPLTSVKILNIEGNKCFMYSSGLYNNLIFNDRIKKVSSNYEILNETGFKNICFLESKTLKQKDFFGNVIYFSGNEKNKSTYLSINYNDISLKIIDSKTSLDIVPNKLVIIDKNSTLKLNFKKSYIKMYFLNGKIFIYGGKN